MRELGFEHLKEKLIYMKTRTELDRIKAREQQVLRLKQSLADEVLDHKIDVRFLTITYQRAGMTIDVIIKEWRGVEHVLCEKFPVRSVCKARALDHGIQQRPQDPSTPVESLSYSYDALNRPISRNADTFGYNDRSEVILANISGFSNAYGYDEIGNLLLSAQNIVTQLYTANNLNQYTSILRDSVSPWEPSYDTDGNLLSDGVFTFTYDAANRLKTISSNGVLLVTNFYDAKSRRVRKVTPEATTTIFYDDWNLIEERIAYTNGTASAIRYYWGKDLSGTLQGAGGIGGVVVGDIGGFFFGATVTEKVYDWAFTPLTKEEWEVGCEKQ